MKNEEDEGRARQAAGKVDGDQQHGEVKEDLGDPQAPQLGVGEALAPPPQD